MKAHSPYSFDSKCLELAEYFLGMHDARLNALAQEIQDVCESFTEPDPMTRDRHGLNFEKQRRPK